MAIAKKFQNSSRELSNIEQRIDDFNRSLDPLFQEQGQTPFYVTGARALLRIGGKKLAAAQKIRWVVSYNATPINTIDSNAPWDVSIGQYRVSASLDQVMDPTGGPETDLLFHTVQSAPHQPMVEMQVLDATGTSLFFSRGVFTEVSGDVSRNPASLGTWSAKFTGILYQHYVSQNFKPYDSISGSLSNLVDGLQNLASDFTGGLL